MLHIRTSNGVPVQRLVAHPWLWADPSKEEVPYAAVVLRNGSTYAGPADGLLPFAEELTHGADMLICPRAEALRCVIRGSVEG